MIDYWSLYGVAEPAPAPDSPPPACIGQVWVRLDEQRESSIIDVLMENGQRVPYCFGVPCYSWPPEGAVLVAGPHAPWRS